VTALVADPIQTRNGIPVGMDHSPGGAVAAADEYVATEQATVERAPATFVALVSEDYVRSVQRTVLAGARGDRQRDPAGMRLWTRGGQNYTTIGAHRLDWYRGDLAEVTAWVGQVFWGPGQPPCQAWELGQTTLAWRGGRWRVSSMRALSAPAPAPAQLPQASSGDDSSAAFHAELAGFTPVSYGSPQ
jgi:hypothetical protein